MQKQIGESRLGYRTIKNEGTPFFDLRTTEQLGSTSSNEIMRNEPNYLITKTWRHFFERTIFHLPVLGLALAPHQPVLMGEVVVELALVMVVVRSHLLPRVEGDSLVVGGGGAQAAHQVNETSPKPLGHHAVEERVDATAEVVPDP